MNERRLNYMKLAPEGVAALQALEHYNNTGTALEQSLRDLVRLRASQLNGCAFCTNMHTYEMKERHEPDTRIAALPDWRRSTAFTERERAALAWTEILTRLNGDVGEPVTDAEFVAAREHFSEKDLVDLSLLIASINAWNRMGTAFRPPWREPGASAKPKTNVEPEPQQAPEQTPAKDDAPQRDAVDDDGGKVTEEK